MKTTRFDRTCRLGLPGVLLLAALAIFIAPSRAGAAAFVYDLYAISPDVPPQDPPWTTNGSGSASVSDPSNVLTLVDDSGTYGPYYTNSASLTISSADDYEVRGRVRIVSNTNTANFIFYQDIFDGTRYLAYGISKNLDGSSRFILMNTSGTLLANTNAVNLTGSDFFQVDLKKVGTSITLAVNGNTIQTTTYSNLSTYTPKGLSWGEGSSPAEGTVELTGVSYGIDEAAPLLQPVPEPSALALAVGLLASPLVRRARRPKMIAFNSITR